MKKSFLRVHLPVFTQISVDLFFLALAHSCYISYVFYPYLCYLHSVRQYAQICLNSAVNYKCTVAEIQSDEGFPIFPSQTGWCKVYRLCPLLIHNRDKIGVAMDGDLKHEDTNLASSTISPPHSGPVVPVGILVQYKVKVRLILGFSIR
ncbi:Beta-arrestin-1 [Fasciolopsis buskii]|uniref:Beta-arrestin-1 n=1 Tax=Fasciolopsis buskii TaxID=27845 RepID=A0A8E0VN34_9TREM|nr:Beta-arrestin-1 [Fasciolopsis buski]